MLYGLDSAYAPSTAAARRLFSLGWRFYCGYVGGPRATHAWSHDDFARLAGEGFVFLPIYVGRTVHYDPISAFTFDQGVKDGDEANVLTGACGFDSTTPLCLDAEYGDWQTAPGFSEYVRGFGQQVNGAGHKLVLYSDTETLNNFGSDLVDLKWGAAYSSRAVTQKPPYGRFDPASPPPWDMWQYGTGTVASTSVDLDSAVDDFPFAQFTPA